MRGLGVSSAFGSSALCLAVLSCGVQPQAVAGKHAPETLGQSLAAATRDFCVPYVIEHADAADLAQRTGATAWRYDVHGQQVVRYRFDNLPGLPEATLATEGDCWIQLQEELPADLIPTSVIEFSNDLRLDGYTIREAHYAPGPRTLVVNEGEPADGRKHSFSACVHGQRDALVQMSGFIVDVTSDPGILADASCVHAE